MANRRMGGPSGGLRGNRSFNQPFQGGSVSPWQGANSGNQGLISQITSNPQQLALALSSLLQPQQQNPPSLLSLNTSGFSGRDRDFGQFGRGRDFRRHEPYSKNRQGGFNRNRKGQNQKKKDDIKKEEVSGDEANEEGETKRDWKDEKNNSEDKKEETEEEAKLRKEKEEKEGPYYDIPVKLLSCFVCNKEMWDGESMKKHVKGRAHRQMLDSLEESIHITVNILRENMRLLEEKKLIELNRVQRVTKRFNKPEPESHCNMCDLKFLGKIIAHRKTEGHQRLKHYLHPNCRLCSKEFPSRMEWIEHRLSPDHLRKLAKNLAEKAGGADGSDIIEDEEEEANDLPLEPLLEEPLEMEAENPILEFTDNLSGLQNLMPVYKADRAVATESLQQFCGFVCELCHRSFTNEDLAQKHLKTRRHHAKFVEALKLKFKEQQKREKEAKEAEMKKEAEKNGQEGDLYDPDEPTQETQEDTTMEGDTTMELSQDEAAPAENCAEAMEAEEEEVAAPPAPKESPKVVAATPVKGRAAAATPAASATVGAVKNGAGPKSKKTRK
ncbi:zinc finger protein on ecdysone puffs isoform X1 [Diorhabda carinulata]|uniref:zinc finger protein on ecdysone puffs isoform X1 n=1 Tax=Diorhabda carinulata TaxID=1163345 RepID=UPI0025A203C3|nr:zinc finger protein on ecdysone puffs isoform X1 [Diorhabda carinulata]